jgi:hypothetical protein
MSSSHWLPRTKGSLEFFRSNVKAGINMNFTRILILFMVGVLTTKATAENVPKIEDSEFDQSVKVIGLHLFDNPFGGIIKEWFLRSFINKKTKAVSHQLYVQLNYRGEEWHFYTTAADDSATSL